MISEEMKFVSSLKLQKSEAIPQTVLPFSHAFLIHLKVLYWETRFNDSFKLPKNRKKQTENFVIPFKSSKIFIRVYLKARPCSNFHILAIVAIFFKI